MCEDTCSFYANTRPFIKNYCFCLCVCTCVCVSVCHMGVGDLRGQKRAPEPPELELQVMFEAPDLGAGNQMKTQQALTTEQSLQP